MNNQNQFSVAQKAADNNVLQSKTIDQAALIGQIFHSLNGDYPLDVIQRVLDTEKTAITDFLAKGYRVIKHNYMILYTSKIQSRKLKCPLDGKQYDLPENVRVNVRIGEGLKRAVQKQAEKTGATLAAANTTPGDKKRSQAQRKTFGKEKGHAGRFATTSPERGQNSQTAQSIGGDKGVGTGA